MNPLSGEDLLVLSLHALRRRKKKVLYSQAGLEPFPMIVFSLYSFHYWFQVLFFSHKDLL